MNFLIENKKKEEALKFLQSNISASFKVADLETKPIKKSPAAPFTTSTMQQDAGSRLGWGAQLTMRIAQRLYENGYITYMRTDSTNLSQEALDNVREMIGKEFGEKYLPADPIRYGSKEGAQEAHEAIRPSNVGIH